MRKIGVLVGLLLALTTSLWGEVSEEYALHLKFLNGLPARTEGSHEEERAFRYITTYAELLDLPVTVYPLDNLENSHSYSSIMEVTIEGESPNELIYLFPMSQDPFGSPEQYNASIATGITLLSTLNSRDNLLTTRLVFLGGDTTIGAQEYLRIIQQSRVERSFVYLAFDTLLPKASLRIDAYGNTTPLDLTERVIQACKQFSFQTTINITRTYIERLRLGPDVPTLSLFMETRDPVIGITLEGSREDTADPESLLRALTLMASLPTDSQRQERNYLALPWRGSIITIRERSYISFLFVIFIFFLSVPFIRKRWFQRYVLTIKRNILPLLLLIIAAMALLWGLGEGLHLLSHLRGIPNLYIYTPLLMICIKVSAALLVWFAIRALLPPRWSNRGSSFYSAAALFLMTFLTIATTLIDAMISVYFIFPLLFLVCAILLTPWWAKVTAYLLSMGCMIANLIIMLNSGITQGYYLLTISPNGSLLQGLIILVYGLFFLRVMRPEILSIQKKNFYITIISTAGFFFLAGVVALMVINPFHSSNPLRVTVQQTALGRQSSTTISGNGPLKPTDEYERFKLTSNVIEFSKEALLPSVEKEQQQQSILSRQEHQITISSQRDLSAVTAYLDISQAIPVIYDSNFPYSFDFDNQRVIFFIGKNPPNPLRISLTLSRDATSTLEVHASYYNVGVNLAEIIHNPYIKSESTYTEIVQFPIRSN